MTPRSPDAPTGTSGDRPSRRMTAPPPTAELVWADDPVLAPPSVDEPPAELAPPTIEPIESTSFRGTAVAEPHDPGERGDASDLHRFATSVEDGRRRAQRLRWLIGGLVAAVLFATLVVGGISLSERRDRTPPPPVPDVNDLVAPDVVDAAVANAERLTDSTAALSALAFRWDDPSGQRIDVTVDVVAGTHTVSTDDGVELRFDGTSYEGRTAGGVWTAIAGDPFARSPIVGLDGLPETDDVLPAAIDAHVVAETRNAATTVLVVDDTALRMAEPAARSAWLATWGFPVGPTSTGLFHVVVTTTTDGAVTHAAIVDPGGGRASFELVSFETT